MSIEKRANNQVLRRIDESLEVLGNNREPPFSKNLKVARRIVIRNLGNPDEGIKSVLSKYLGSMGDRAA